MAAAPALDGLVALVTGGLSGLGLATAIRLARDGADIVVLTLAAPAVSGELKHFEGTSAEADARLLIEAEGKRFIVVEGDAASRADLERTADSARDLGGIDILVNNAATNCYHPLVGHDEPLWRRVLEVNLVGPALACQILLPHMLDCGFGRIVSIASTNAHIGSAGYTAYCASKHGLLGFTRALALEVAGSGVTANTVSPSFLDTPTSRMHLARHAEMNNVTPEEMLARIVADLPQGRFIRPDEVAAAVSFLCSREAESVNGADLPVTGAAAW